MPHEGQGIVAGNEYFPQKCVSHPRPKLYTSTSIQAQQPVAGGQVRLHALGVYLVRASKCSTYPELEVPLLELSCDTLDVGHVTRALHHGFEVLRSPPHLIGTVREKKIGKANYRICARASRLGP